MEGYIGLLRLFHTFVPTSEFDVRKKDDRDRIARIVLQEYSAIHFPDAVTDELEAEQVRRMRWIEKTYVHRGIQGLDRLEERLKERRELLATPHFYRGK